MNLFELFAKISIDDKGFNEGLDKAGKSGDTMAKKSGSWKDSLLSFKGIIAGVVTGAVVGFGKKCIEAAEALEQTNKKTDVIFGDMSQQAKDWALENERTFGAGSGTIQGYMNSIADITQGMGMAKDESYEMSQGVVELATQLANWNGIDTADAINDIQSALTGSTKGLEKYGVKINDAAREQAMLSLGLSGTYDSLDNATKAQVIYQATLEASGNAIEYWEDGNRSMTFSITEAKEQWGNITETIGGFFLPIAKKAVDGFADMVYGLNTFVTKSATAITDVQTNFAETGDMVGSIAKAIEDNFGITLSDGIKENLSSIVDFFSEVWLGVKATWDDIAQPIFDTANSIFEIFKTTAKIVFDAIGLAFDVLGEAFDIVWNSWISPVISGFMDHVSSLFGIVEKYLPQIEELWNNLSDLIKQVWDEILKPVFEAIGNYIQNVLVPIWKWGFEKIILPVVEYVFKNILGYWNNILLPVLSAIVSFIKNVFTGNWSEAWENIKVIIFKVWEGMKYGILGIFGEIINKCKEWATNMGEKAKEAASNFSKWLVEGLKELPNKMMEIGKNIVQGIWSGITNAKDWLIDKIKGFGSSIMSGFKSIFSFGGESKTINNQSYTMEGYGANANAVNYTLQNGINSVMQLDLGRNGTEQISSMSNGNLGPITSNNISMEIDGVTFARLVTPLISEQLAKLDKRNKIALGVN